MTKKIDSPKPGDLDQQGVDRIRDIVFGSQMREYEHRFQQMKHDMERMRQELERLSDSVAERDADHLKKLQVLQQDMRKSDDGLRTEFRESAQKLMDEKVDRLALSELFIELGNNLKHNGSVMEMIGQLAQSGNEG